MKRIILLVFIVVITSISGAVTQNYNVNPIPSYNYKMTSNTALFSEKRHKINTREKRDMVVEISTASHSPSGTIFAKVWVVKKSQSVVLGPYTVYCDVPLSVPIDNGQWSVMVKCDWEVFVNVWAE